MSVCECYAISKLTYTLPFESRGRQRVRSWLQSRAYAVAQTKKDFRVAALALCSILNPLAGSGAYSNAWVWVVLFVGSWLVQAVVCLYLVLQAVRRGWWRASVLSLLLVALRL